MFSEEETKWNRYVLGNIFDQKYRCLVHLNGIQQALSNKRSSYLTDLEAQVRLELEDALRQEESLWRQKSLCLWLREGE